MGGCEEAEAGFFDQFGVPYWYSSTFEQVGLYAFNVCLISCLGITLPTMTQGNAPEYDVTAGLTSA